jgi:hypothetical protein
MTTFVIFQGFSDMDATANPGEFILRFGVHINRSGDGPDARSVICSITTTFTSAATLGNQIRAEMVATAQREGFQVDGTGVIIVPQLQRLNMLS